MIAKYLVGLCGVLTLSCATPELNRQYYQDIYSHAKRGGFAGYFDTRVTNTHTGHRDSREWSADSYADYLLRKIGGTITVNGIPANNHSRISPVGSLQWDGPQVWKI